jgi:hypothetical protein
VTSSSHAGAAWRWLQERGSLSRIAPTRGRIVPKTHFSTRGITIRSLSRYLALSYEAVDVRWRSIGPGLSEDRRDYTIALLPWPLSVRGGDFRPAPPDLLRNMNLALYGFFEFAPEPFLDHALAASLLEAPVADAGHVDAVVLPEAALTPRDIGSLQRTLAAYGATLLVAGVREPALGCGLGRNYLHFGVRASDGWRGYEQDKHHRWCLDERQIRQYHLTRTLDPAKLWWEAIDVRERTLHVIDVGGGITTAPLVCEDLAHGRALTPDGKAALARRRAAGVLLTTTVERTTLWTADGRRHPGVPRLALSGVHQLRAGAREGGRELAASR